ncbi:MAG: hypothetical protein EP338_14245 [Bacteroidetes bacterium]|nr:MAG: hypothetical protein EP338_14245 [Bacteroidota bacterium]
MKTKAIFYVAFLSGAIFFTGTSMTTLKNSSKTEMSAEENILNATYKGITEEGLYLFQDDSRKEHHFDDYSEEIGGDLYNDELIGKKFKVTWVQEKFEEYDDDDNPTGKYLTIRKITKLEKLK